MVPLVAGDASRGGIHQRHGDRSHAQRLAISRAGEDDVFHPRAAQALGRLLAEHPTDGVAQIRFSAPFGPTTAAIPDR